MEWTQEKTLYFIEKYREEEVLWNPAHLEHYNKLKKEDAWNRLASLLDSDRQICKNKMTSLLASLRREKKKIKQSTGRGKGADEVYQSNWFAYKAMIFLLDRNNPRTTTDTLRKREGASEQPPANKCDNECPPSANKCDNKCPLPANKCDNDCPPPSKKGRKAVALSPEEIMASTFNILKKKIEQTESTPHKLDECEAYGIFLANKLRAYSKTTKIHVQHYISNILFSADRGEYDYVGMNTNNYYSQGYSTQPIARASPMPQQSPEAPASNTSHQTDCGSPANTSHQTDCGSPAMSEQFLSEFGDLIN